MTKRIPAHKQPPIAYPFLVLILLVNALLACNPATNRMEYGAGLFLLVVLSLFPVGNRMTQPLQQNNAYFVGMLPVAKKTYRFRLWLETLLYPLALSLPGIILAFYIRPSRAADMPWAINILTKTILVIFCLSPLFAIWMVMLQKLNRWANQNQSFGAGAVYFLWLFSFILPATILLFQMFVPVVLLSIWPVLCILSYWALFPKNYSVFANGIQKMKDSLRIFQFLSVDIPFSSPKSFSRIVYGHTFGIALISLIAIGLFEFFNINKTSEKNLTGSEIFIFYAMLPMLCHPPVFGRLLSFRELRILPLSARDWIRLLVKLYLINWAMIAPVSFYISLRYFHKVNALPVWFCGLGLMMFSFFSMISTHSFRVSVIPFALFLILSSYAAGDLLRFDPDIPISSFNVYSVILWLWAALTPPLFLLLTQKLRIAIEQDSRLYRCANS